MIVNKLYKLLVLALALLPMPVSACFPPVIRDLKLAELKVYDAECNSTATMSVVVSNKGTKREASVLRFFVDRSEIWPCTRVISVEPNSNISASCNWQTVAGRHTIRAVVEPLVGESITEDNEKSLQVNIFCCSEGFLNKYRCFFNWRQQKYQYADCRVEWRNIEYCSKACSDGECVPSCRPTYFDEYRCSGAWLQRKYQNSDCSVEWMNYVFCQYGCSDNRCKERPCPINAVVQTPSRAFAGDTLDIHVKLTNSGNQHANVKANVYLCSNFCWLMSCSSTVRLEPNSSSELDCSHFFHDPGSYQLIVEYKACDSTYTSSSTFSVSNVKPTIYLSPPPVEVAEPLVFLKPYYVVRRCDTSTITFELLNTGGKSSNFSISVEGEAAGWMTVAQSVTIDKNEKKTIIASVSVPCDVEEGSYEFSLRVKNSKEASSTSFLKVVSEGQPILIPLRPILILILTSILVALLVAKNPNTRREPEYFKGDC